MQLGDSTSTALTVTSAAMKLNPATAPFSPLVSIASMIGGMFKGHVSRPKHYADVSITQTKVAVTKTWGNSDAKGASNPANNVAAAAGLQISKAIVDLTNSLGGTIPAPFSIGYKFQAKYKSIGAVLNVPVTKTNPEKSVNINDMEAVKNLTAYMFMRAVNTGLIKLSPALTQQISSGGLDIANAVARLQSLSGGMNQAQAQAASVIQATAIQNATANPQQVTVPTGGGGIPVSDYPQVTNSQFTNAGPAQVATPSKINPWIIGGIGVAAVLLLTMNGKKK